MKILKLTGAIDDQYVRVNMDGIIGYEWDQMRSCTKIYNDNLDNGLLVKETPNEIDALLRRGDYIVGNDYHSRKGGDS